MSRPDPMEKTIEDALTRAGIPFVRADKEPERLDFLLGKGVFIEVKQFHSDRIAEQMSRASDVIAIQGKEAAAFFAGVCSRIEALEAELAAVKKERDVELAFATVRAKLLKEAEARLSEMEKEVERLRCALIGAQGFVDQHYEPADDSDYELKKEIDIALAARRLIEGGGDG